MSPAVRTRSASPRKHSWNFAAEIAGDKARFAVFCAFVACVFAMGGGSRADIASLVVLRPIAFLVCSYALLVARPEQLRAAAVPLALLAALAAVVAFQLLPLPASLWVMLPGRELYVRIAGDAGLPLSSRPLTLSPSRTINTLFSLSVPLATVLITTVQNERFRSRALTVLLVACGVSALVAIAQMASSGNGALYLYRITNTGFPVGLLANRNHQALLMVILLVLIAHQYGVIRRLRAMRPLLSSGMLVSAGVVLVLVLVAGSRAGLVLALVAGPMIAWMMTRKSAAPAGDRESRAKRLWIAGSAVLAIASIAAVLGFSRATSLNRLWSDDALADNRVERLPLVIDMLRDHWLFGLGFGSFEGAFKRYEAIDMLTPTVFNQAHNDWIQFPLEGGILAVALLLFVLARIALPAVGVLARARRGAVDERLVALMILALIALASLVDYPLRTPVFMLIAGVSFMLLTGPASLGKGSRTRSLPGAR